MEIRARILNSRMGGLKATALSGVPLTDIDGWLIKALLLSDDDDRVIYALRRRVLTDGE